MAIGPYNIRPAEPTDIASVVALDRATSYLPHWAEADYEAALQVGLTDCAASGVHRCFFIAESQQSIVGFAVGSVNLIEGEGVAELESVAVADFARGSGIGRALCAAVIRWARDCVATFMELEVRSSSKVPIALYSSLGFIQSGRRPAYYRDPADDALLMRLQLREA